MAHELVHMLHIVDEINRDKVVSGVIGRAELNGSIPIVIGNRKTTVHCISLLTCLSTMLPAKTPS